MATLPRPGVEISQEIITESPTVLTPSLVPCIIGPCFQIVNPIDEDGALDPQASVSTAARLSGTADINEPVSLRGRGFVISVNNTKDQVINMPAAVNGDFSMSFALIVNTINKQLTGAIAEITPGIVDGEAVGSRLVFRTQAKGPSAQLLLKPHPDGAAASAYGGAPGGADDIVAMAVFRDIVISGQTNYTNIAYNIPYTSLPSPMTSPDECVWQGQDITVYRFFANTLSELSTDSACNWNAFTLMPSLVNNNDISSSTQPALANGKTILWGKPATGTQTNTLCSPGVAASLTVPLGHGRSAQYNASDVAWPDATGDNSLKVEALGLQTYLGTGNPDDLGAFIGSAGNAITVTFTENAVLSASYGAQALQINCDETHTFDELEAILSDPAFTDAIDGELLVTLSFNSADGAVSLRGFTSANSPTGWVAGGISLFLGGGSDPVDFSANAVAAPLSGDDERSAWICGSTDVGGATATALGVGGETLNVSIDGAASLEVVLTGGVSVATTIDTALGVHGFCATAAIENSLGESINPLRINTTSTNGHDSTIEISSGSSRVIERLFSGAQEATETIAGVNTLNVAVPPIGLDTRRLLILGGTDYNTLVSTNNEVAIEAGRTSIVLGGTALATVRTNCDISQEPVNIPAIGAADTLGFTTELAATTVTLTGAPGLADINDLVVEINTRILANVDANQFEVLAHEANGTLCLTRVNTGSGAAAAGQTIQIDAASTTAAVALCLDAGLPSPMDTVATSATCSITVKDVGVGNSLQVTSASIDLAGPCPLLTPIAASTPQMTEYFLGGSTEATNPVGDANRGFESHLVDWSQGEIAIATAGDSTTGLPDNAVPVTFATDGGSTAIVSYKRMWSCAFGPTSPSYTTRLVHGRSNRVLTSDMLWNNGSVLGRIVGVQDWAIGAGTFTGAQIVISEFAIPNRDPLDKWYIVAENLISGTADDAGNNIRPEPEAEFNDLTQMYFLKPGVNTNSSGIAIAGSSAPVYAQIKALRKDVTADTANPGLLVFSGISEVESLVGPIDPDNPLAMGLYLAFLNTSQITISALGVGDVSPDAPNGTLEGYAEALDFLELNEVYALAPLTHDMEVFKKFSLHVTSMSEPEGKLERMFLCCPELPTELSSTLIGSADFMISDIGGGKFELNIADEAAAAAFNIPMAIDGLTNANGSSLAGGNGSSYLPSDGIYVDREGDAFRYLLVGTPSADTVTIDTSDLYIPGEFGPGSAGNDDSYYRVGTDAIANLSTFEADGELCTLKVRQAAIDMSGTAGKLKACETLAEIAGGATGFQNRRMVIIQPEQVGTTLSGLEILVPGFYLGAGIAGMIGQQNPSQPFTNFPMVGFTRPVGSSDTFSENQMATAAAGGIYWVIQDVPGGNLASRHQLTTDMASLKTRELSILKAVDFIAKLIRGQVKRYIGRNNITGPFLETVALSIQASLNSVSGSVVAAASLDSLNQSADSPDTVEVTVSLTPFYPANIIKITIIV